MDLDDIFADIGEFGRYQKLVLCFLLVPGVFPCGFHAYNQLFMAAVPDHWCRVPELEHLDQETAKNLSIPLEEKNGKLVPSQCLMYDRNYSRDVLDENVSFASLQVIPCQNGWTYDHSKYDTSVVMEWDLVCDKSFSTTMALVLFAIAGLIGNYICGRVQDKCGRKPSFFIYLLIQSIFGLGTACANNFPIWILLRMGVGFTIPAILSTPYILSIELIGARYRTTAANLTNIAYSLSLVFLSLIVWMIRDWRYLAIVTTAPFLPLFCFYSVFPESPRWLLAQDKIDKAEKVLNTVARNNRAKKVHPRHIRNLQRAMEEEKSSASYQKEYGIRDLFKGPNLRMKTIIITFIWFSNTSVYVGLSYYAPALGGDEFLNFFLAGVSELPTYLFLWPSMERCGRRWVLCLSMVVGGSACLATFLVRNDSTITLALYCIGKMGISCSFVVLPLMASELYPTVVRGLGMSTSSVMGMLGPVFIPLVNYLGSDMLTLPLIIMGALLAAGGVSALLLPETLNQSLPQTLEDGEKAGLRWSACCTPPQSGTKIAAAHESAD